MFLDSLMAKVKADSFMYKSAYQNAQDILSTLVILKSNTGNTQAQAIQQNTFSVADELSKLKALLDSGILTQEEFDQQKNKILN